jgi:hypothetical protein
VRIDDLIGRLEKAAEALRGGGYLDATRVSFLALSDRLPFVEKVEIVSSAYRQLEMFKRGAVGPKPVSIFYSPKYLRWRVSVGFPPIPFWTLVWRGILYRSLAYYVKGGELYVKYDERRREAVKYLSQRAGFHILDVPERQLRSMAIAMREASLRRFVKIMKGKNG